MNLQYQRLQYLYTTIGAAQMGFYVDEDSVNRLVLKDKGVELLGGATASWSKQVTKAATKRVVGLELTLNAPDTETNYEYGIRIINKYKTPAYIDNSEYWPKAKFYGDNFPALTVSAGSFSSANAITMENNIMDLIQRDTGYANVNDGAVVRGRRAYVIVDTDQAGASTFVITGADGTAFTVTASTAGAGSLAIDANADATFKATYICYRIGADTYLITSKEENVQFTLAAGTTTTITRRELLLDSTIDDILFDVQFEAGFATTTEYNLFTLNTTDAYATALNAHIAVDGTINECTTATNAATVAAAISGYTGVYATYDDDTNANIYVAGISTVTNVSIDFPYINSAGTAPFTTNASVAYAGTKKGSFSELTADDVFRVFAEENHAGMLSSNIRLNQAADVEYVCFSLVGASQSVGSMHSASGYITNKSRIQIYVPKSVCRAELFDASETMNDTVTEDMTIDEFFDDWAA